MACDLLGQVLLEPPPVPRAGECVVVDEIAELVLVAESVADVARDRAGANDLAVGVADRRHGQRHVNEGAVLSRANRLVVLDPFAGSDPGEDLRDSVGMRWRHEHRDRLADHLVGGVAIQALGARVPADDRAIDGLADDRIIGGFDHRHELGHRLLGPPTLCGVADRARDECAVLFFQRAERDLHGKLAAVLATAVELKPGAHPARVRVNPVTRAMVCVPAVKALGHKQLDTLAEQFLPRVAEQPLGLCVDEHDLPRRVDDHHRVRSGLQQPSKPVLHPIQLVAHRSPKPPGRWPVVPRCELWLLTDAVR